MKHVVLFISCLILSLSLCHAQYAYEPNETNLYGLPNPEAPVQIKDYQELIGLCDCKSTSQKSDGTWADPEQIIWSWRYIMNGHGVQDMTLKPDGSHSGSIRQFIPDSSRWYVHYFSNKAPSTTLGAWEGNRKGNKILLYRDQKAPNGIDGKYRITFYDISKSGFKWIGEWVSLDESVVFPTWKIDCIKRQE